jgi:DNA-binding NarL/FixJ family response regulator
MPPRATGPFALDAAGRWREASAEWERRGCPYERALALADGNDEARRDALAALDELGAVAAAALVRRRLQERGARGVPRGPRASTRANPVGLTNRQLSVLELLREGLSNQEIAARLYLSTRTVDHHVSAILRKLDARTRTEAASRAIQLGV